MLNNDEFSMPLFKQLPPSLQEEIIDLFIQNKFVQAKKLHQEYVESLKINALKNRDNPDS